MSYTFQCTSHSGAFLDLKDHARRDWIERNSKFTDYMRQHHASWYAFVTGSKVGLECSPEDIVLVRGTMKTSSWNLGAFIGQEHRLHDISAGGDIASTATARLRITTEKNEAPQWLQRRSPHYARSQTSTSLPPNSSTQQFNPASSDNSTSSLQNSLHEKAPSLQNDIEPQKAAKDQCIFLSYYKIKNRTFLPKRIVAKADPPVLDKDRDGTESIAQRLPLFDDVELESHYNPVS